MEGKNWFMAVILVVIAAAVLITAVSVSKKPGEVQQGRQITVSGYYEFKVAPDRAEVYVGVQTNGTTAKDAQDRNTEIMNNVQAALKKIGISGDDIETIQYSLWPWQEWDPKTQEYVSKGYRLDHVIKVSTKELGSAGMIVDAAVGAGANVVQQISFTLSPQREKEAKQQALAGASKNAKEKAEGIAAGLDMKLGDIVSVQESSYNYLPWVRTFAAEAGVGQAVKEVPSISPQSVTVSAQVSVVYSVW